MIQSDGSPEHSFSRAGHFDLQCQSAIYMTNLRDKLSRLIIVAVCAFVCGCGEGAVADPDALASSNDSSAIITARRDALRELSAVALITAELRTQIESATSARQISDIAAKAIETYLKSLEFDGIAAYDTLERICAIGSRTSGTDGMRKQQELLLNTFEKLGAEVDMQLFTARHPINGSAVPMANMIIQWHPDRKQRVMVCAHYDTRPFPDNDADPKKRKSLFVGANDGASGVGLLVELGRFMKDLDGKTGVDFVLFDGEELVFESTRDPFFLGSEHFAREVAAGAIKQKYEAAVLLDMVADKELQLYQEINSCRFANDLVQEVWSVARRLGIRQFYSRRRHEVRDDHLALNEIARIPAIDIIDFDYPRPSSGRSTYWHTTNDIPENCSPVSLARVGTVMLEWLRLRVRE